MIIDLAGYLCLKCVERQQIGITRAVFLSEGFIGGRLTSNLTHGY